MTPAALAPARTAHTLHDLLEQSRQGRRLQRLFHTHEREVLALAAVHPEVRSHLAEAAERLALAAETGALDASGARVTCRALDDLHRYGTGELRHTVTLLRDELPLPRGGQMTTLLAD